jgi:hypothetical protein
LSEGVSRPANVVPISTAGLSDQSDDELSAFEAADKTSYFFEDWIGAVTATGTALEPVWEAFRDLGTAAYDVVSEAVLDEWGWLFEQAEMESALLDEIADKLADHPPLEITFDRLPRDYLDEAPPKTLDFNDPADLENIVLELAYRHNAFEKQIAALNKEIARHISNHRRGILFDFGIWFTSAKRVEELRTHVRLLKSAIYEIEVLFHNGGLDLVPFTVGNVDAYECNVRPSAPGITYPTKCIAEGKGLAAAKAAVRFVQQTYTGIPVVDFGPLDFIPDAAAARVVARTAVPLLFRQSLRELADDVVKAVRNEVKRPDLSDVTKATRNSVNRLLSFKGVHSLGPFTRESITAFFQKGKRGVNFLVDEVADLVQNVTIDAANELRRLSELVANRGESSIDDIIPNWDTLPEQVKNLFRTPPTSKTYRMAFGNALDASVKARLQQSGAMAKYEMSFDVPWLGKPDIRIRLNDGTYYVIELHTRRQFGKGIDKYDTDDVSFIVEILYPSLY